MKIIVAGCRDYYNYDFVSENLSKIVTHQDVIVSGCASGVDMLGVKYAHNKAITVERHPAMWNLYGKAAGPIRNEEMAKCADMLVAFWDGKSKGTKNMIKTAAKYGLETIIIKI